MTASGDPDARCGDPGRRANGLPMGGEMTMKKGIHPKYKEITIVCGGCGATIRTRSTKDSYKVDVCSNCHPFYTGRQKYVDSAGRVERFQRKWGAVMAKQAEKKAASPASASPSEEAKKDSRPTDGKPGDSQPQDSGSSASPKA